VVKYLVENGADIYDNDKALESAAEKYYLDVIKL